MKVFDETRSADDAVAAKPRPDPVKARRKVLTLASQKPDSKILTHLIRITAALDPASFLKMRVDDSDGRLSVTILSTDAAPLTAMLSAKNIRKAVATIAEHGAQAVALPDCCLIAEVPDVSNVVGACA
jgi:hypothetical protein